MPLQNKIKPESSSKLKGNEDPEQLNAIYKQWFDLVWKPGALKISLQS